MVRIGPTLVLAAGLGTPVAAQSALELTTPGRALARVADVDASGDVSADEQRIFLASFETAAGEPLERTAVMARLLPTYLDFDRDGRFTGNDAEARLRTLDVDASGELDAATRRGSSLSARTRTAAVRWSAPNGPRRATRSTGR